MSCDWRIESMAKRIRVGDIVAIPLTAGRFAFGRVLKDASIAVYRYVSDAESSVPPLTTPYAFVVGVYQDVLCSGSWPLAERVPFENEDDAWPPPHAVHDVISGRFSIYYKGQMRPASPEEAEGLEPAAVWDKHHILQRIE